MLALVRSQLLNEALTPKTYYDIFGLPQTSTHQEIKRRYHELARAQHPDRANLNATTTNCGELPPSSPPTPTPTEEVKEIIFLSLKAAWECLRDPETRNDYDLALTQITTNEINSSRGGTIPTSSESAGNEKYQAIFRLSSLQSEEVLNEENEPEILYAANCRCGEGFDVLESELIDDIYAVVECDSCCLKYLVQR